MRCSPRTERPARDAGTGLVEVIVAMGVFSVLATMCASLLLHTTDLTGRSLRRSAAANLALEVVEVVRGTPVADLPDGTVTSTRQIGSTAFTVTQVSKYLPQSSSGDASLCTGSSPAVAHRLVTVTVTWQDGARTNSVRNDTLRVLPTSSTSATTGIVAVLVSDATRTVPTAATVTLTAGAVVRSSATDDDGCAVFTGLAPGGGYVATTTLPGYATPAGSSTATSTSLSVTAGAVTQAFLETAPARSVSVAFDTPADAVVPSGMPLVIAGSVITQRTLGTCPATVTDLCVTALPGAVRSLYPDIYTLRAGLCSAVPRSDATVDVRTTSLGAVTLPASSVTVTVRTGAATPIAGRTVTFTRAATTGCGSGEQYTTASVAAGSRIVLPYGSWTVSTTKAATGTATVSTTVTTSPTATTATAVLTVTS